MSEVRPALEAETAAIIGLGLIGGSIARGLRAAGFTGALRGAVETQADAERALALGLVDCATTDIAAAADGADLVVVAVPVDAMAPVFATLCQMLSARTVITDVGSTKRSVMADARAAFGAHGDRFVPGHPISGTEHSGLEAGFAGLFRDKRVILTPTPETDPEARAAVEALWTMLGARVSLMDAAHHDEVLAATSHLPHVLAFALVDTLAGLAERTEIFAYAAGGFTDFTRIASSDPQLWCGIVNANREAIVAVLDRYLDKLGHLRGAIVRGEAAPLVDCFTRAKAARDQFKAKQRES
jgi:prephenate dehydrogenase